MKTAWVIFFTAFALTFASCKREGDKYTVKGRLLKSCDNPVPVKNFTVYLYNDHKSLSNPCNSGQIATATTNENGEFELGYDKTCRSGGISLQYDVSFSSATLVDGIEPKKDYNLGDIYYRDNGFYIVKIKTNQPYTSSDTLFYDITGGGKDSSYSIATGPFYDGQVIDTLYETVVKMLNYPTTAVNESISWILKSGKTDHKRRYLGQGQQFYIEPCKKYSEVVLDISK
ncbi:MAG TPA: hypothetical protein VEC12_03910 [Bacteroidia bacterium]|nr:hypothetical protein [Bacteroidia bacterium]